MRENGIDKYANAQTTMGTQYINNNVVAKGCSRKPELQERSLDYLCSILKGQDRANGIVRIQ